MDKWLRNYNPNDTLLHATWQFYDGAKWNKDKYLKATENVHLPLDDASLCIRSSDIKI